MKKIETSIKTWRGEAAWLRARATELESLDLRGDNKELVERVVRLLRERADFIEHPRREVV